MLKLKIPDIDVFDNDLQEFVNIKGCTIQLEHSLISLHRWEQKWNVPFLTKKEKTLEQTIDYIKCMTISQNVNPMIYKYLTDDTVSEILKYIEEPMTATTFSNNANQPGAAPKRETVTAELIYYWMIALQIPVQFEKWHLNSLLTLIEVCNIKNTPPKKLSKNQILSRNKSLNAARRKALGTKG